VLKCLKVFSQYSLSQSVLLDTNIFVDSVLSLEAPTEFDLHIIDPQSEKSLYQIKLMNWK